MLLDYQVTYEGLSKQLPNKNISQMLPLLGLSFQLMLLLFKFSRVTVNLDQHRFLTTSPS